MCLRHEHALAAAIADDSGLPTDDPGCRALAHFALEAPVLVRGFRDPDTALDQIFDLLDTAGPASAPADPAPSLTCLVIDLPTCAAT